MDQILVFLGELTEFLSTAHTRVGISRAAACVLEKHIAILGFELAWENEFVLVEGKKVSQQKRNESKSIAWTKNEPSIYQVNSLDKCEEKRIAQRMKADYIIVLSWPGDKKGGAIFYLKKVPSWLEREQLKHIAKLFSLVQGNCYLVEKVAKLSQRAHHSKRELESQLKVNKVPLPMTSKSSAMNQVIEKAKLVASHNTTVLILGESGTGKEVMATYIHNLSRRSHKSFIAINCGAIPHSLLESELFGHEKAAFTGAQKRHTGYLERAHGGTLFLDEVGELPLLAQVKLLRFLQEGTFLRVGGEEVISSNVRIITATNRSLLDMINKGDFREDLYYRLHVFPIILPPLRERKEDLPPLTRELMTQISQRMEIPLPQIDAQTMERLLKYSWPGNIRELANVLETAIILRKDNHICLFETFGKETSPVAKMETLDEAIKTCIEQGLFQSKGKIYGSDGAAHYLKMKPGTLQSKMKKLGIDHRKFR